MNTLQKTITAIAIVFLGTTSINASASTVDASLTAYDTSVYSTSTFSSFLSSSLNTVGNVLQFKLLSEDTRFNNEQTFTVKIGESGTIVFEGADISGGTENYNVTSLITDILFQSNSGTASQTGSGVSANSDKVKTFAFTSGKYAFAYEDFTDNDFNDMVVGVSAVPVPAALPLMASALGLFGFARSRRQVK